MTKLGTPLFVPDDTDNVVINFVRELRSAMEGFISESSFGRNVQQRLITRLNECVAELLCPYAGIGRPLKALPVSLPDQTVCINRLEPSSDSVQFDRFRSKTTDFLLQFEIAQHAVADEVVLTHLFHIFMGCAEPSATTTELNKELTTSSGLSNSQNFVASHAESMDNKGIRKDYFRLHLQIEQKELNQIIHYVRTRNGSFFHFVNPDCNRITVDFHCKRI
jgi:hypothetical protein